MTSWFALLSPERIKLKFKRNKIAVKIYSVNWWSPHNSHFEYFYFDLDLSPFKFDFIVHFCVPEVSIPNHDQINYYLRLLATVLRKVKKKQQNHFKCSFI